MALTVAGRNDTAAAFATGSTHMSLHTADPGATGANEVNGGTPAYARKASTWAAAANGAVSISAALAFDVPSGVTVTHIGLWSAVTGGVFKGGTSLGVPETFTAQGQYVVTATTATVT